MGLDEAEAELVGTLLDQYHLFIIDKTIARLTAKLRRRHGWKLPDAFQAALCTHHKIKLTTRNVKDFNPRKYDFVDVPYSI